MGRRVYDHKRFSEIQAYIDEGHGFRACHAKFGIAHPTWVKAIEGGDLRTGTRSGLNGDGRRVYDWAAVQRYYAEGHSFRDCQREFGFSSGAWHDAKLRGEIHPRRVHMTIDEVPASGGSRRNVKHRLLNAGLLRDECSICGITHWRDVS